MVKQTFLIIIIFLATNSLHGQTRCDTINKDIFVFLEHPPTPNISYKELEQILNVSVNLNDFFRPEGNIIYLNFIINCKGKTFNYDALQPINNILLEKIIQTLESNLNWTPGIHNNKPVDFAKTLVISTEGGKFKILHEQKIKSKKMNK